MSAKLFAIVDRIARKPKTQREINVERVRAVVTPHLAPMSQIPAQYHARENTGRETLIGKLADLLEGK